MNATHAAKPPFYSTHDLSCVETFNAKTKIFYPNYAYSQFLIYLLFWKILD